MSLRENKLEITLFLVLFISFSYFYQGGGANQNARLGQMRAVAELGQLHFKGLRVPSHDVVNVDGNIYPNKAPGMSLIGIAPYFLISRLKGAIIGFSSEDFYHLFSCYLVTVFLVALPCALGGVVFFRLLGLFYPGAAPRLICTMGLFLGTPAFAYSTVLYGHMVSSVLTLISFYLLYKYLVLAPDNTRSSFYVFLAGLSGGWAVVTEYPTLVIVFILALFCYLASLARHGRFRAGAGILLALGVVSAGVGLLLVIKYNLLEFLPMLQEGSGRVRVLLGEAGVPGWVLFAFPVAVAGGPFFFIISLILAGRLPRQVIFFILGLVPLAMILLFYNYLVFGELFFVAYFDKQAAAHAAYRKGGILGLNVHARQLLKALYQTSFGPFRGFFHLSPFLILFLPGIFYLAKEKGKRGLLVTMCLLVLSYFFINSIYPYWYGGRALGARHAMEILPYFVMLTFFFIVRFPRLSALLAAVSIFFMLTATSVRPEEYVRHPFRDLYFYSFFNGILSINRETTFQTNSVVSSYYNAFNLGEVAGLKGQLSLIPLYTVWLIGGCVMFRNTRKEENGREGAGYGGLTPGLLRAVVALLVAILVVGVLNFLYQLQLKSFLEELAGAGQFRVSPAEAPLSHVQIRTSPGHRLQVWEVMKPFSSGDTISIKIQHAAAGREGGFYITAFGDKNKDGKPDLELALSTLLTARSTGDWSCWTVTAPEGKLFVGNTWDGGARVFFDRKGWDGKDFSSTMYYGNQAPPVLSTGPRSTNMAIEITGARPEEK